MEDPFTPRLPPGAEAYGAWYDRDTAEAAVQFFPDHLRHTEAQWYGTPFVLSAWQADDIIRPVYGLKRADGTRLIRQVYIELPRKNGKTELAAGMSLLGLVADGEFGGQAYAMAVNKEQAGLTLTKASVMVSLSPTLSDLAEVYKTSIYVPDLMASLKVLSHTPGSKHGFSPSFAVADELHEWPDGELHDVVHKGTAARRQPLEVLITTAGKPGQGYGWEMHQYARKVLSGAIEDPTFWAVIYAADPQDDWRDPATWAKANPGFGVSVKEDYLRSEVVKCDGKAHKIADFKRYHLNVWTEQVAGGLPMDRWQATPVTPVMLASFAGRQVFGGLDLSSTTDLSALCLVAWRDDGGLDVWWRFWMPSATIKERSKNDHVAYDQWIDEGWIVGTEGDVVDYDVIRSSISGWLPENEEHADRIRAATNGAGICDHVDLVELAIDRWNATQITTQLSTDGVTVVPFGQGFASMTAPTKELERLITGLLLNHGDNPVATWMGGCVEIQSDGAENCKMVKPDRRKSTNRIDGMVALAMALGRALVHQTTDDEYEYTGM
jgi:phage terminase large subunit-like protein